MKPASPDDLTSMVGSDENFGSRLTVHRSSGTAPVDSKRTSGQGTPSASSPRHGGRKSIKDKELDYNQNFEHFEKCLKVVVELIKQAKQDGKGPKEQSSIEPPATTIEIEKKTPEKKGKRREEKEELKSSIKEKEKEPKDLIRVFDDPIASSMAFLTLGNG